MAIERAGQTEPRAGREAARVRGSLDPNCQGPPVVRAVSCYEPPRFESRCSEAPRPCWSCSGLSPERAVPIAAAPIAATPAARAAFLATRPTFGRRAFFAVPDRFALV